ncbi:monoterpene epsilon-lactone hydrolase [Rhodococcus sp. 27YEA15]|uniref:alpha/beta hydrolase n=1 Tax=Rhodococcus sp. 27YEA15 TaxID=3156259 RepID=UPI003C7AD48A
MSNHRSPGSYADQIPARPSRRAAVAAAVTGSAVRPLLAAIPLTSSGVWFSRRLVAMSMGLYGSVVRGTRVIPVADGAVVGEWVCAPGVSRDNSRSAIYYLHGSAYVVCSARTHRALASNLSRDTGLPVFVLDYRLAPEHLFPAAADDVESGYRWIREQGYAAENVVVAGDSAGGHLALDLVIENMSAGIAQPAAVVLFSPLIDLTFGLAAEQEKHRRDPMISAEAARRLVDLYTHEHPEDSPRLRLTAPAGHALPPFLVQAGGAEMLSADARHLAELLRAAGGTCDLQIWPGQMHVFQALPRLIPEAGPALRRAAQFVADVLAQATDTAVADTARTDTADRVG